MNDKKIPFLKGILDVEPCFGSNPKPSDYSFPYDLERKADFFSTVDTLFLNFNGDVCDGFLDMDYRIDQGHIFSKSLWDKIKNQNLPPHTVKKLALADCDRVHEGFFYYVHFYSVNISDNSPINHIDTERSVIVQAEGYGKYPIDIMVLEESKKYCLFPFNETMLFRFLVLNDSFKELFYGISGCKLVPLKEFPEMYSKDYNYPLSVYHEKSRRRLP